MYKVRYHKRVVKFLQSQPLAVRQKIVETFDTLKAQPHDHRNFDIKPLKGFENAYRLRIGKYRILYRIDDGALLIFVTDAGSRGDIYK